MKSIFTKLTVLNIAAGVLGMAILYLVMDRQLSAGMTENYITHGEVVAQSLAKAVEPAVVNRDLTSVQSALDTVLASPGVRWAYVTSPDGRVLAHTFVPEFPASLSAAGISNARAQVVIMVSPATGGATVFTYPVLTGIVGAVHVGFDREKLIASIHRMEWLVVGSIFAVMLVVTVALALFTRRMVAPIRALTQAAARLGRDQRAVFQVLPVRSNDEVGVLTQAFNSMATEIRGYQESLEERVHQRTQELRQANQNLEVEVTERKRAEGALLRANQTLSTLIQASPAAIITVDQDAIVRLWNPAAEKLFGWAEEEVVGHPLPTVPAGWEKEFEERVRRAFSGETALPTEVSRVRKDGSLVEISAATAAVRDADGAIVGVMAVMQDVTQRKRAEEALQKASAAAEAASRAKSEFLANMSHEIRTPMNGVIGMTELALDTDLTSEQREYLEMVKSSADSLLTVINDILDFSKIEAGKLELDPIEFDIRSSIEETARMLALKAHQKGLELITYVEPDVPEILIGDPVRLRQIFFNLLGNAVKFTDQGEIVLHVWAEENAQSGLRLHFSIRDTGIGIPEARQTIIFEAFSQADSSTTRKYGGTGLGLTITARLISLMGGHIWVESTLGQGSIFHFTAGFGVGQPQPVQPCEQPCDLKNLPVLIVDDNATNRRILRQIVQQWQMRPTVVDGGQEALALLQHAQANGTPFPLVLTDMQMPDMDGFTLAKRIQDSPALAGATIMMLTSAGQRGDAARCRELGVKAYLTKPIKQSELRAAIVAVLRGNAAAQAANPLVTRHSLREAQHGLRILLAEDNRVNQIVAMRLLEQRGHSVTIAASGLEALAELESRAFDLVLMDVQMPEMDGLEATQAIREKEKISGKHLPIVALTAHSMSGDEQRFLAAGMDAYLAKPLQPRELFATVERFQPAPDVVPK